MLLIVGATFFSFTLYSGEIIGALVKSNLISINLEKISHDVGSKNQKMIANQQLEDVTSKLEILIIKKLKKQSFQINQFASL